MEIMKIISTDFVPSLTVKLTVTHSTEPTNILAAPFATRCSYITKAGMVRKCLPTDSVLSWSIWTVMLISTDAPSWICSIWPKRQNENCCWSFCQQSPQKSDKPLCRWWNGRILKLQKKFLLLSGVRTFVCRCELLSVDTNSCLWIRTFVWGTNIGLWVRT